MRQVDQFQTPGTSTEAFHFQLQPGPMLGIDGAQAAHQIPALAPDLECDGLATPLQLEVIGIDGDGIVTGVKHRGFAAGFQKPPDREVGVIGRTAGIFLTFLFLTVLARRRAHHR